MVKEILNNGLLTRAIGLLISIVVFLSGTLVTVSGYYLRSQYQAVETRQVELERRTESLAATEIEMERTIIRLDAQLNGVSQQIADTKAQTMLICAKLDRLLERHSISQ
jgi:hypothetical protein